MSDKCRYMKCGRPATHGVTCGEGTNVLPVCLACASNYEGRTSTVRNKPYKVEPIVSDSTEQEENK